MSLLSNNYPLSDCQVPFGIRPLVTRLLRLPRLPHMFVCRKLSLPPDPPAHFEGEEEDEEGEADAGQGEPETQSVAEEDGDKGDQQDLDGSNGEIGHGIIVHCLAG